MFTAQPYYVIRNLIILLEITCVLHVSSQTDDHIIFDRITSENIKIEKGLSQNTVRSILQDQEGFMWFGTWDGLNKYDGNSFTIFNRESGLSNQTINSLFQDSTGVLWIGTEVGLNRYNPRTNELKIYTHRTNDPNSLSDNHITHIYQDNFGNIWIATSRGLNMYQSASCSFQQHLVSEHDNTAVRSNWINRIIQDDFNNYWLATRYGLIQYDYRTKLISRYYHKPGDINSLCDNFINTLYKDKNGNLWIGTRKGLSKLDNFTKTFHNYYHEPDHDTSLSNNNVTSIIQDQQEKIWIGTDNGGLNLYTGRGNNFIRFQNIKSNVNSLGNNRVYCLYEDNIGTLWIGTFNGVNKIDRHTSKFQVYRFDSDKQGGLNNNFVRAFHEIEPDIIWIGTENGINVLNESSGSFQYIVHQPDNHNSLPSNNIRDIYLDSEGICWIGTADSGLARYNRFQDSFKSYKHIPNDPNSLGGNFILKTKEDKLGNIWVSTGRGLSILNKGTESFKNYNYSPVDSSTFGLSRIYDIHIDKDSILWFASQNGLSRYFPDSDSFAIVPMKPAGHSRFLSNILFSIYEDDSSNLWLGTRGGGLIRYNKLTGEATIFNEKDGLPNNVVYGLLADEEGNYWVSTNWGISKFNPSLKNFINYDMRDGLQSNEFNSNSLMKTSGGKMFFGGMMGFNCFYPDRIKINNNKPPIRITNFSIYHIQQPDSILQYDTIYLNYDDNFFSIGFAALDYTNPSKNKYRYILRDLDKDWRQTGANDPNAEYTKVMPGTYDFTVIGSNNDGIWNTQGDHLTIIITPPWYQRWTFRIPFSFAIVVFIWFMLMSRIRGMKRKHEAEKKVLSIEKQMFELEQKALQLQMNPHFIFNSLNSIQSFILKNDTDKAINYLAKFSQLMRLTLSNSRESYIPLKDEISALRYYMDIEKLRFDNKFEYSIQVDSRIDEDFMEIPPMIIQPFVENAIIHGLINSPKPGKINLSFKLGKDSIFCTIKDNGIGREKAEILRKEKGIQRKSRGMLITKERLDILTRQHKENFSAQVIDLKDTKGNPTGTQVEITIHFKES